jgi:hypothetical protein
MHFALTSSFNYRIIVPLALVLQIRIRRSVLPTKLLLIMKAEKVILSFVAVFVGLIAAGIAFYLYQSTKVIPFDQTKPTATQVTKTAAPTSATAAGTDVFTVDDPSDQQVFSTKLVTIKGTAVKGATITVSTDDADQVVQPADNGDFTLTQTIPDGTSIIEFTAIFPDGTEKKIDRTVTFSTENF